MRSPPCGSPSATRDTRHAAPAFRAGAAPRETRLTPPPRPSTRLTPQINAISTLIVAVVAIALFLAWRSGAFRAEAARV